MRVCVYVFLDKGGVRIRKQSDEQKGSGKIYENEELLFKGHRNSDWHQLIGKIHS